MTSRVWCFTLNNWSVEEREAITRIDCKFLVFGEEEGDSMGTPHLQGFIRFKNSKRRAGVSKLMPRAWLAKAGGSDEQNIKYCTKSDPDPFSKGIPSSQGSRNDLTEFAKDIKKMGYDDAFLNTPSMGIKFARGAQEYNRLLRSKVIRTKPTINWYFGDSGTGKTRKAYDDCLKLAEQDPSQVWISNGTLKWFDGYNGQPYVILDEFRKEKDVSFSFVLRLLDRYPFQVPIKGRFENWTSTHIFITSPKSPTEFRTDEEIKQITRRVDTIVDFNLKPYDPVDVDVPPQIIKIIPRNEVVE